ncbi:MAG: tRNA lysidine(34) synthetase TilS [Coriobacteriaceae bacterium]|nr:tRNA lysidine(34) synthetase TilS [Coriobacteriaceae bacterium]
MPTVSQRYGSAARARGPQTRGAQSAEQANAPVVLMVSGGADSTALLLMACSGALDIADGRGAQRIARARLHVLHVNHHLRGAQSDADEAFVRELCAREGLPLCVEHASFAELSGRNLEAAAREVRYAAARRYVRELSAKAGTPRSAARILTAHTASDRAETFFMNAIKGAGAAGLSSIPRRRNIIVRPLIDQTHEDLVRYLQVAGESWREDESNQDTSYLRNFIRHRIMPMAAERNPSVAHSVSAACDILGDEDAFMSQLAATALRACTRRATRGSVVLDAVRLAAAEVAIARRVVRAAVASLNVDARLEMRHIEAVLACVAAGEGSVTLPEGIDARVEFGSLTLRTPAERETAATGWLAVPGSMPVANGSVLEAELVEVPKGSDPVQMALQANRAAAPNEQVVLIDAVALGYAPHDLAHLAEDQRWGAERATVPSRRDVGLWVDSPVAGDLICPFGMHGRSKKLSDLLNEARVPLRDRPLTPVVRTAPGGAIVWVAGIRLDDRFKCTATSKLLVKLTLRPFLGA